MEEFRAELCRLCGDLRIDPHWWPFACGGIPHHADIFVVGVNPATSLSRPFLDFWPDRGEFRKDEFLEELKRANGGKLKNTRANIEFIAEAAGQSRTLDTNVYLRPTPSKRGLTRTDRDTRVVEFLLTKIRPKVVLVHDEDAIRFFKNHCRDFADDRVVPRTMSWEHSDWQFRLLCSAHLGFRGVSRVDAAEKSRAIGRALANAC
jgi:hypothetical protein